MQAVKYNKQRLPNFHGSVAMHFIFHFHCNPAFKSFHILLSAIKYVFSFKVLFTCGIIYMNWFDFKIYCMVCVLATQI